MSAVICQFPVRDTAEKYRLQSARIVARRAGWPVHETELWLISHGCSQAALNLLSDLAVEQRMSQRDDNQPEPAA